MIPDLYPDQDKTDTRIISIVSELKISDVSQYVSCPDSDVFLILVNITELAQKYDQQYYTALMSLHVITQCDSTNAFNGLGEVRPLKPQRIPSIQEIMCHLENSWNPPQYLVEDLEEFTCHL